MKVRRLARALSAPSECGSRSVGSAASSSVIVALPFVVACPCRTAVEPRLSRTKLRHT
jgi:hypothetical protein